MDVGDPRRIMLSLSSSALAILGYPLRALERGAETVALGLRSGGHSHALSLSNVAQLRLRLRQPEQALEIIDELAALCAEHGFGMWAAQGSYLRGEALVQLGQLEQGASLLRQSGAAYQMVGGVGGLWRLPLAEAYARMGRVEEGLTVLEDLRDMVEERGLGMVAAELRRIYGELILMKGGSDADQKAQAHFEQAIAIARRQSAKLFELRATVQLARLLERTGRLGEARALLTAIYNWFTEGFDLPDLREARALLDQLTSTSA